jgi:hypothetical protein
MARNWTIVSATFDGHPLGSPQNYRKGKRWTPKTLSAGVETVVTSMKRAEGMGHIQVFFNDLDDLGVLENLSDDDAQDKTLVLVTQDESGKAKTMTLDHVTLIETLQDAQHVDYGAHMAMFLVRGTSAQGPDDPPMPDPIT